MSCTHTTPPPPRRGRAVPGGAPGGERGSGAIARRPPVLHRGTGTPGHWGTATSGQPPARRSRGQSEVLPEVRVRAPRAAAAGPGRGERGRGGTGRGYGGQREEQGRVSGCSRFLRCSETQRREDALCYKCSWAKEIPCSMLSFFYPCAPSEHSSSRIRLMANCVISGAVKIFLAGIPQGSVFSQNGICLTGGFSDRAPSH